MGAQTPTVSYVGNRPTATVAPPMRSKVITSDFRRPYLSPTCPKIIPPRGRKRKPTAYVAKENNTPKIGSLSGKKSGPKTIAAAVANTRSEEHTSELQSRGQLVCRLLLEKKNI